MKDTLMTSGYTFEGYRIKEYLGFCSGGCALGTGFLSSLEAGVSELFGMNSTLYEGKLDKAKKMSLDELKDKAKKLGANAIIGLDVDYTTFSTDSIGVIASGTAVIVEKTSYDYKLTATLNAQQSVDGNVNIIALPVLSYYTEAPVRPFSVLYNIQENSIQVIVHHIKKNKVWGMNFDIVFNTIFNTTYKYEDINFVNMETEHARGITEPVKLILPENQIKVINSAYIKINHYIDGEEVVSPAESYRIAPLPARQLLDFRKDFGNDIVCDFSVNETTWQCVCGYENTELDKACALCGRTQNVYEKVEVGTRDLNDLMPVLETLPRAMNILTYLEKENLSLDEKLLQEIKSLVNREKLFGSMKNSCIDVLKKYMKED